MSSLNEHIRILYRNRKLITLCTVVVVVTVLLLLRFQQPKYRSAVRIIISDRSLTDVVNDNVDTRIHLTIANQLDLLESDSFRERVVGALPADILSTMTTREEGIKDKVIKFIKKVLGFKNIALSDKAVAMANLKRMLDVSHRGGGVVQIVVRSADPDKARRIAEIVANEFVQLNIEHLRKRVALLEDFFDKQIAHAYQKLKDAQKELAQYKTEKGIVSTQGESPMLSERLNSVESSYIEVKTQRQLAEKRLQLINKKLHELERRIPAIRRIETLIPQITVLKDKLSKLEKERLLASALYTDKHPKLVSINHEIEQTIQELRQIIQNASGETSLTKDLTSIFSWQDLFIEKTFIEVEIASLRNKEKSYWNLTNDYRNKLLYEMPQKERGLYELTQKVELCRQAYQSLVTSRQRLRMVDAEKIGNVQILTPATQPTVPENSHKFFKLLFAGFVGLTLGVGLAYLREWHNTSIHALEDVENNLGLTVLGVIPDAQLCKHEVRIRRQKNSATISNMDSIFIQKYPKSSLSESFCNLHTQLNFLLRDHGPGGKSLIITSPGPNEGKTTISANLALSIAMAHQRVVLIDADLRRPSLHHIFKVSRNDGLVELIRNRIAIEHLIEKPRSNAKRLELITSGAPTENPLEIFSSEEMKNLVRKLKIFYDYVIIDCPPLITFSDALILGSYVDGIVLVVESGKTQENAVRRVQKILQNSNLNPLGVILNKVNFKDEYGPYNYYTKYYRKYYDDHSWDKGSETAT